MPRHKRSLESRIYQGLRIYNDAKAVKNRRIGRRIGRRVYGKLTGRLARRVFR